MLFQNSLFHKNLWKIKSTEKHKTQCLHEYNCKHKQNIKHKYNLKYKGDVKHKYNIIAIIIIGKLYLRKLVNLIKKKNKSFKKNQSL